MLEGLDPAALRGPLSALAAFLAVILAGWGMPALASGGPAADGSSLVARPVPHSALSTQSVAVSSGIRAPVAIRDGYRVTDPPRLAWPVDPSGPIADGFGPRVAPCAGCSTFHEGVDLDAGDGAPVRAIAAGTVVAVSDAGALGVHVEIAHLIAGSPVLSVYGHLRRGSVPVTAGHAVAVGEVVGLVGNTGASTGSHLHLEIRPGGVAVDPIAWLRARVGTLG